MKKPEVMFLVNNRKMGGVMMTLKSLTSLNLSKRINFRIGQLVDPVKFAQKANKPNVIVFKRACCWRELPKLFLLKLFKRKAKLVIQEHHYSEGFERVNVRSVPRFRLMLKLAYGCADRVVAVSQAQAQWMLKHNLVHPDKLTAIEQSRNLDPFLKVPPKTPGNPPILGAYGRFGEQKGFETLIEAMKQLPSDRFKLYLGGSGPQEDELKQLAQGMDNIEFVGRIDDVPGFLETCDVVVIPSRWEPWGNVCREAKAAGKPVISSDIDGLSEQVNDCGLLVPPEDPVALAQAIASLPDRDLESWGKIGRNSEKQAWKTHLNRWENLLWELIRS